MSQPKNAAPPSPTGTGSPAFTFKPTIPVGGSPKIRSYDSSLGGSVLISKNPQGSTSKPPSAPAPKSKPTPSTPPPTADVVRVRVQHLILEAITPVKNALVAEKKSRANELSADALARKLEEAMFAKFKGAGQEYRGKSRSVPFNLKSSPDVTRSLFQGTLSAESFIAMSEDDVANEQLKLRRRLDQEAAKSGGGHGHAAPRKEEPAKKAVAVVHRMEDDDDLDLL